MTGFLKSEIEGFSSRQGVPLTLRESEVLQQLGRGLPNVEIGHALGIAPRTVESHISRILLKLGANNRTQAVIYALEGGWLQRIVPT